MNFNSLIQRKRERFEQLEREIADPRLFDNRKRAEEIMREHASLKELRAKWNELEAVRKQLDDNRELAMSRDVEIAAMADDEIPDLEKRVADLERKIQIQLLPSDQKEDRDAIVATRAGNGSAGPHSHVNRHGRGVASSRRGRCRIDTRRFADRSLSSGRPWWTRRKYDRLGCASPAHPDRHDRAVSGRAQPDQEQGARVVDLAGASARAKAA